MTLSQGAFPEQASPPAEIIDFFAQQNKAVLTFLGFSGSGYEEPDRMLDAASDVLDDVDPADTIINIGATPDGIGAVYEIAKDRGFKTTGIVSTQAIEHQLTASSKVDRVFLVQDQFWGGYLDDGESLSPTSKVIVEVSHLVVAIGGGMVSRDEFLATKKADKKTWFIPAEMNHKRAIEKAQRKGLPIPADFRGALEHVLTDSI